MPLIDYNAYLDGDEWPSESAKAVVDETGAVRPEMKPVIDMPPQYAAAALHKLVRWAQDGTMSPQHSEQEERRVRDSTLGRLLARKALTIDDFELYTEHGVSREALSTHQSARALVQTLWEEVDMPPSVLGTLAERLALRLSDQGYTIYKEGPND